MIQGGPFNKADKIAAWTLAAICVIAGLIGLGLAVAHTHWRLGLASTGTLGVGALFGIAAARGRPMGGASRSRSGQRN
jgi:hypothetical protein